MFYSLDILYKYVGKRDLVKVKERIVDRLLIIYNCSIFHSSYATFCDGL